MKLKKRLGKYGRPAGMWCTSTSEQAKVAGWRMEADSSPKRKFY